MWLSLQRHPQIQYWDESHRNPLLSLLMDRMNTQSESSWIQIGWENISNTRSHMMDMERNMMSGCSETTYLKTLVWNPSRIMSHSFMPNTLRQNITRMKSGLELKEEGLSRKDKKTYSKT